MFTHVYEIHAHVDTNQHANTTGKDLSSIKQHEEGAILAAITAKLRYSQAQLKTLLHNNKNLSKALKAERTRQTLAPKSKSAETTRMPDVPGARSVSCVCA